MTNRDFCLNTFTAILVLGICLIELSFMLYGFNALNFRNIMLKVYSFNKRAIKCNENIGFNIIGRRRNAIERNQETHDIIFMDILYTDLK